MTHYLIVLGLLSAIAVAPARGGERMPGMPVSASVCFTPPSDCEQQILDVIASAKNEIRLQAYYLTSTRVLRGLRDAISRGVEVKAILDRVNARKATGSANYLYLAGAEVWIDLDVTIAHNKLMLVDGDLVVGGSFNFTKSAQDRNAENVTFINDHEFAMAFYKNWEARRVVSQRYPADDPTPVNPSEPIVEELSD